MRNLRDVLYKVSLESINGNPNLDISGITFDSRQVAEGTLFVAIKGTKSDGHQFIDQAIKRGAVAVIVEEMPENISDKVVCVKVKDSSEALGIVASNFYENPSEKIKLVGITGTNGKTTMVTLLYKLFSLLGYKVGMLSTVENRIGGKIISATHTTPDAVQLNQLLSEMVEAGCEFCFMEASSHAIQQKRIAGLKFKGAVFTNITHDHLDYHGTFDEYIKAKKLLFDHLDPNAFALVNADDTKGKVMLQNTKAHPYAYALKSVADFRCKIIENTFEGLMLNIDGIEMHSRLIGEFNAYNTLAVYATASLLGIDKSEALKHISTLLGAEGRFDYIISERDRIIGIVDYAHTPDALEKVLQTINNIKSSEEKVITVVGCGGDRDKTKRPVMGKIAAAFSDQAIFTSDNPRSEDPEVILSEMLQGVNIVHKKKVLSITNRAEAIKTACTMAKKKDIILVAGKGHEKYQEVKGVKNVFDDKQMLSEILKELNK